MSSQNGSAHEKNAVALSCQSCKTGKSKCDKGSPCSACVEHGRNCVPIVRARLPRGRTKEKKDTNGELKARLSRLESLVLSLKSTTGDYQGSTEGQEEDANHVHSGLDSLSLETTPSASNRGSDSQVGEPDWQWIADSHKWLGSTLWTQLGEQINGIHAVLEADDPDGDPGLCQDVADDEFMEQDWTLLNGSLSSYSDKLSLEPPPLLDHSKQAMIHLWLQRIDPVMKLVHEPSFTSYLQGSSGYLNYASNHPNVEALRAAVFYCCVCSVTDSESLAMFGVNRTKMINDWRRYTEQSIAKADYMVTRDVTMLQAMIYYLTALRTHDTSSRSWAFLAIIIRIATGMHLHRSCTYFNISFFQAQMQGQVWYHLMALDHLLAMDRGSDPIISANSYNTPPPMHIDDRDFSINGPRPLQATIGFTDKTYNSIRWGAPRLIRLLNFVPAGDYEKPPTPMQGSWRTRVDAVRAYEREINETYIPHLDLSIPLHLICKRLSKTMITIGLLFAFRPLQRHPRLPPPPKDEVHMLQIATEAIEASENFHNSGRSIYDWNSVRYVPWHPLAVLLSELCQPQSQYDNQLMERAWMAGKSSFARMADQIAEGSRGSLWTPLKKLMKTAEVRMAQMSAKTGSTDLGNTGTFQGGRTDYTYHPRDVGAKDIDDAFTYAPKGSDAWDTSMNPMQDSWLNWQGFIDDVAFGQGDGLDQMFLNPQIQSPMG